MIDLSTEYLGLKLKNPLVPSSSPLTGTLDSARELEDAGASALILPSLFEESILASEAAAARFLHEQDIGFGEAASFLPVPDDALYRSELDEYLEHIQTLKSSLAIPVIASLNGVSTQGWTRYGKQLQDAGADALELNVYYVAADVFESGAEVEERYINVLSELKQHVTLPISMKLSSQFSSVGHFVRSLQEAGAQGVSLFNRFYQPDIDLLTREVVPTLSLSSSYESLLRVHWIASLFGKVDLSLAVTGGIHTAADALKALMAGADVTHLCSVLLKQGPQAVAEIEQGIREWMAEHEYASVQQLKGSVCRDRAIDPSAYDRANYVQVMQSHRSARGVWR
ncbi:dihydroorotate dehydrogenase-like protein [Denitrificimonas caeni]|uniref:dihydroorotate dehydrogenase-like protein n=1 Tax=Denitrificimonas caeni TaxID=521720 RepID=UPI001964F0E8|nr:dihydroorotate dehydrogenase-like protein [Denitrificimonas caeni]